MRKDKLTMSERAERGRERAARATRARERARAARVDVFTSGALDDLPGIIVHVRTRATR